MRLHLWPSAIGVEVEVDVEVVSQSISLELSLGTLSPMGPSADGITRASLVLSGRCVGSFADSSHVVVVW